MVKYLVVAAVVFSPVLFASSSTAEMSEAPEKPVYAWSLRASLGAGGGSLGIGGRAGVASEYWLTDVFSVGGTLTGLGQTSAWILGGGTDSSAWVIAPVIGLRSDSMQEYFFGTLGAGYARVTRTELRGFCLDFGGGCPPNQSTGYNGYGISAAFGWLAHPGSSGFEIGPVLRFEAVRDFRHEQPVDSLVTLNIELGLAFLRSR